MNMYEMMKSENSVSPREKEFARFIKSVCEILKCDQLSEFTTNEIAWDLFADDCDPENAASEILADGGVLIYTTAKALRTVYGDGSHNEIDLDRSIVEVHPGDLYRVFCKVAGVSMWECQTGVNNLVRVEIIR